MTLNIKHLPEISSDWFIDCWLRQVQW